MTTYKVVIPPSVPPLKQVVCSVVDHVAPPDSWAGAESDPVARVEGYLEGLAPKERSLLMEGLAERFGSERGIRWQEVPTDVWLADMAIREMGRRYGGGMGRFFYGGGGDDASVACVSPKAVTDLFKDLEDTLMKNQNTCACDTAPMEQIAEAPAEQAPEQPAEGEAKPEPPAEQAPEQPAEGEAKPEPPAEQAPEQPAEGEGDAKPEAPAEQPPEQPTEGEGEAKPEAPAEQPPEQPAEGEGEAKPEAPAEQAPEQPGEGEAKPEAPAEQEVQGKAEAPKAGGAFTNPQLELQAARIKKLLGSTTMTDEQRQGYLKKLKEVEATLRGVPPPGAKQFYPGAAVQTSPAAVPPVAMVAASVAAAIKDKVTTAVGNTVAVTTSTPKLIIVPLLLAVVLMVVGIVLSLSYLVGVILDFRSSVSLKNPLNRESLDYIISRSTTLVGADGGDMTGAGAVQPATTWVQKLKNLGIRMFKTVAFLFSSKSGKYKYQFFLIQAWLIGLCIVVAAGDFWVKAKSGTLPSLSLAVWALIVFVLFQGIVLLIFNSMIFSAGYFSLRLVGRRIRDFNTYVYKRVYKTPNFMSRLTELQKNTFETVDTVKAVLRMVKPDVTTIDLAKIMFSVNMYLHFQKIGLRNPNILDALNTFSPYYLLTPAIYSPSDFLFRKVTFIDDYSELMTSSMKNLVEDGWESPPPRIIFEASMYQSEWTAGANNFANAMYAEDAVGPFFKMAILMAVVQCLPIILVVLVMRSDTMKGWVLKAIEWLKGVVAATATPSNVA